MSKKICKKCGVEKDFSEFYTSKKNKDGLQGTCKKCKNMKYSFTCAFCGKDTTSKNKSSKFCSRACASNAQKKQVEYRCDCCKKIIYLQEYQLGVGKHHYCSKECKNSHHGSLYSGENHPMWDGGEVYFNCEICGAEHHQPKSVYHKFEHHYCSKECRYEGISKNYTGDKRYNFSLRTINCDYCGKIINKKPSRMERNNNNFCSVECSSKFCSENYTGDKRYNYNHNLSDEERLANQTRHSSLEYRKWMRDVLKRDNYTCALTGIRGKGNLAVHHLDGWNWCIEKRYDVSNGITIRKEIHELFHKIYGLGDNTKEQFEEFVKRYKNNEFN